MIGLKYLLGCPLFDWEFQKCWSKEKFRCYDFVENNAKLCPTSLSHSAQIAKLLDYEVPVETHNV